MLDFNKGFYGRLRNAAGPLWVGYVEHDFVKQIQDGTLPEVCFKRFLTQDYLFLLSFARANALLASKSDSLHDIEASAASLSTITSEWSLHIDYCKEWGITEDDLANEEELLETIAYTRYVLDVGHTGDRLDLLTALIPCFAGYAEIGLRLARSPDTKWQGNPYAKWIKAYESEQYINDITKAISYLNRTASELGGDARFDRLSKIFNTVTKLETAFWQMGLNAR